MTNRMMELHELLNERQGTFDRLARAWNGDNPASFMTKKSREQLDGKLSRLGVNFPRLVVNSKVDRLSVSGFREVDSDEPHSAAAWARWVAAGMVSKSERVHTDYYLYGSAYVTVWGDGSNAPAVTAASPRNMVAILDPLTGRPVEALRRWSVGRESRCMHITPDSATVYGSPAPDFVAGPGGWARISESDNPLGVVPVVPFIREQSSDDTDGTSAVADVLDLSDALAKLLADAMVTSEHYARPRRWATGLEIEEDEDGNIRDPFRKESHLQSEDPDTKFGQFPGSTLDGYTDMIATITQQIGSLTGLPPHYLGLHGDQPANADGVRAAEAQLASAAYSDQRALDSEWSAVAQLMAAVESPAVDPLGHDYAPIWNSPEIRTPSQAADAALKQRDIGIPLHTVLVRTLGYTPDDAAEVAAQAERAEISRAAGNLSRLMP